MIIMYQRSIYTHPPSIAPCPAYLGGSLFSSGALPGWMEGAQLSSKNVCVVALWMASVLSALLLLAAGCRESDCDGVSAHWRKNVQTIHTTTRLAHRHTGCEWMWWMGLWRNM